MKKLTYLINRSVFGIKSKTKVFTSEYINDRVKRFFRYTSFDSQFVSVILKINSENGRIWRTLGTRTIVDISNKKDINNYVDQLIVFCDELSNWYNNIQPENIVFEYINVSELDYKLDVNRRIRESLPLLPINIDKIKGYDSIPFNNNYLSWGRTSEKIDGNTTIIRDVVLDKNISEIIIRKPNQYTTDVAIKYAYNLTSTFSDFNKDKYVRRRFANGKMVFFDNSKKPYFYFEDFNSNDLMHKIKEASKYEFNVCTLDLETFVDINNEHKVLCACFYDGKDSHEFYITDYSCQEDMLLSLFETIMQPKYHKTNIYIHNCSSFDLGFLLRPLYELTLNNSSVKIDPIIKDGKFLNIKVSFKVNNVSYHINIKDSLLLLLSSLAKLAKQFGLEDKGMFPYNFVKPNNLNYVGKVPIYSYFDKKSISYDRYLEYKNIFKNIKWNLRIEALKYCTNDCILLYNILKEFSILIYNKFSVNLDKTPSLPALALKIYRTKFMPTEEMLDPQTGEVVTDKKSGAAKMIGSINNISFYLYNELKDSYFGGHVNMNIPQGATRNNESVQLYDVNSLYLSVMKDNKFPNKLYAKFIGDIRFISEYKGLYRTMLGIYRVRVTAPIDIKHPILPYRDKFRVIYPTDTWEGMYCSEELKNAERYGYTFEILNGYLFTSADLFSNYVDTLHHFKESFDKSSAMYLISKNLMNSLYGRFGLNPVSKQYVINSSDKVGEQIKKFAPNNLDDHISLGDVTLCSFTNSNNSMNSNSNVAIASFVTAYARIKMSGFMNKPIKIN